jgi:hypothetical protein
MALPEGGGAGHVVGAEDCVELVELHCPSLLAELHTICM